MPAFTTTEIFYYVLATIAGGIGIVCASVLLTGLVYNFFKTLVYDLPRYKILDLVIGAFLFIGFVALLFALWGLGFYGRNSLIIAPELGSLFIIAGVFVPLAWEPDPPLEGNPEPGGHCGTCRACIEACPTGAISEAGRIDPRRCIQALSTDPAVLADEIKDEWGARLYGCQTCQEVCPYNRELGVETETHLGELGPSLPLRRILAGTGGELAAFLKASVLDRKWIPAEAIRRNALLAAGHRSDRAVQPMVEAYRGHPLPGLADAAEWALERFSRHRIDKADL